MFLMLMFQASGVARFVSYDGLELVTYLKMPTIALCSNRAVFPHLHFNIAYMVTRDVNV